MRYPVPALEANSWHSHQIDIEKSQFIAWLAHTPSPDALHSLVAAAKAAHPNASHHCSAFVAGPPGEQTAIGFSDDGEPGGTAGRPMFQVLNGSGIGEIGCVVIRYFGGIKLGTGGLARAYAQAVSQALDGIHTREIIECDTLTLRLSFAQEADVRAWCTENALPVLSADYDGDGVRLALGWPRDRSLDLSPLENRLKSTVVIDTSQTASP
ncbi:YigZ family protein [Vreelandella aquamarina]|uniref:IMPACT family protein n=1 Tax=Vreelandella aquamarina TaxID=77097 RepID=UPI0011968375|nr:YigZ family protein [Halomonas sp.]TVM07545.1 MAG: IMPACT family protein [Halomonas sp.]